MEVVYSNNYRLTIFSRDVDNLEGYIKKVFCQIDVSAVAEMFFFFFYTEVVKIWKIFDGQISDDKIFE